MLQSTDVEYELQKSFLFCYNNIPLCIHDYSNYFMSKAQTQDSK